MVEMLRGIWDQVVVVFILECCVDMYQEVLNKTTNTFGRAGLFVITEYKDTLNIKQDFS